MPQGGWNREYQVIPVAVVLLLSVAIPSRQTLLCRSVRGCLPDGRTAGIVPKIVPNFQAALGVANTTRRSISIASTANRGFPPLWHRLLLTPNSRSSSPAGFSHFCHE